MFDSFANGLAAIPPVTLAIFGILILTILYSLPRVLRSIGVKKLGPLEIEHTNQTINHDVLKQIDNIDIDNREALWDMTEDLFLHAAMRSSVPCAAAVGHIIDGIAAPIRTMVLLNHIAPKLCKSNEELLRKKIVHGITRALRDVKMYNHIESCPVTDAVHALDPNKYNTLIDTWIESARSITAMACAKKIKLYSDTLDIVQDKHWATIYNTCIEKNKHYITDMGYTINKFGDISKA